MRRVSLALLSFATVALIAAITFSFAAAGPPVHAFAEPPLAQAPPAARAYTGPGSCAAAACHGSIRPVAGSRILQTEYTTWIAQDRHARAAQVLSNPVSVRMAKLLGLPAAHSAPKCLACHTLDAPEAQQARTFVSEGVSCESCHGPASAWLGPHTTKGWTHAQSVQAGMFDTKDLVKRTEMCLSCHLGTADKFVDHEMIAAGHPDLVFDLEAFSAAMPRHWKASTESDPFAPVRAFTVGQLVHLRSSLERLALRINGASWPEYAEMDCFACHHSLGRPEDSWRQSFGYDDRRPGNPAVNVARWVTARHVVAAYDATAAGSLDEVMRALARDASRLRPNVAEVVTLTTRARTILDAAIARAVAAKPDAAVAMRLLRAIAADVEAIAPRGERAAEQAAMALETLYLAAGQSAEGGPARAAFDELFQQFQSPSAYDPRRFIAQVKKIESALGR
ncbi:MAG TPA: multiheme c-type cytochrome [Vicinamibacterales bacterium]|nr:multiheme c-type cytochrome [Vicinamibacterales bacterium]